MTEVKSNSAIFGRSHSVGKQPKIIRKSTDLEVWSLSLINNKAHKDVELLVIWKRIPGERIEKMTNFNKERNTKSHISQSENIFFYSK